MRLHAEYLPNMMYMITLRARGIDAENLLEGVYDPYIFYRDAYRQRRLYDIYNGQPPEAVIDEMQGTGNLDVDKLLDVCDNIGGKSFCALADGAVACVTSAVRHFRSEFEQGYHTPAWELFPYAKSALFASEGDAR